MRKVENLTDLQYYKRINRPSAITLVSANKSLQYGIIDKDTQQEIVLKFNNGALILDAVDDAELIIKIKEYVEEYYRKHKVSFDKVVNPDPVESLKELLTGENRLLPFMVIDAYEALVTDSPQRIKLKTGEVVEVTPKEIAELIALKEEQLKTVDIIEKEIEFEIEPPAKVVKPPVAKVINTKDKPQPKSASAKSGKDELGI